MERVPIAQRPDLTHHIVSSWRAISLGVVVKTTNERQKYWKEWANFATTCGVSPSLTDVEPLERDIIICAFANKVRQGTFGRQRQVSVQTVTTALAAISKTIQLAGEPSPIYCNAEEDYKLVSNEGLFQEYLEMSKYTIELYISILFLS